VNIEQLQEMTDRLPKVITLEDIQIQHKADNRFSDIVSEYDLENGTGIAIELLKISSISILRFFGPAGSIFPWHSHTTKEIAVVYSGKMRVTRGDKDKQPKTYVKTDHVYFKPGEPHTMEFLEDTWVIGILSPANGGFPSGG